MKILAVILLMICPAMAQTDTGDSVTVSPAEPTANDEIRLNLYDASGCCCAAYVYDSAVTTGTADTMILLSFKYDYTSCAVCMCPSLGGRWLSYKTGPLKAGTYGIYEVRDPCYPGKICPRIALIPVRIGEVTVTRATQVSLTAPARTAKAKPAFAERYDLRGMLIRSPQKSGAYVANAGSKIIELFK